MSQIKDSITRDEWRDFKVSYQTIQAKLVTTLESVQLYPKHTQAAARKELEQRLQRLTGAWTVFEHYFEEDGG